MVLVTIAIPTLERLGYLQEAVRSALAQSYGDVEVLIGQDPGPKGPDPAIRDWCLAAAAGNPRIHYQLNNRNLGLAGNWNALARAAQGLFLVIIGDDDRLAPQFVERLMRARDEECDVVFCNHHVIDAAGRRLPGQGEVFARRYARTMLPEGRVAEPERLAWRGGIPMSAALVRTRAARALGFREDLNTPEAEFFIRLARTGSRFYFVPDYLAEYRVHDRSATWRGLRLERLVRYLISIEVAANLEADKASTLGSLLPEAVGRCLVSGASAEARRLLLSCYYPRAEFLRPRGMAQALASLLPAFLGGPLYRALRRLGSSSG